MSDEMSDRMSDGNGTKRNNRPVLQNERLFLNQTFLKGNRLSAAPFLSLIICFFPGVVKFELWPVPQRYRLFAAIPTAAKTQHRSKQGNDLSDEMSDGN